MKVRRRKVLPQKSYSHIKRKAQRKMKKKRNLERQAQRKSCTCWDGNFGETRKPRFYTKNDGTLFELLCEVTIVIGVVVALVLLS